MGSDYLNGNAALNIQDENNSDFEFPIIKDPEKTPTSRHTFYNSVYTYRGLEELQELKSATGKDFKWIAALKPERLALHETIVGVSTKIRTRDEDEMRAVVSHFYKQIRFETHMIAKDMETWRNGELYNQVTNTVKAIDSGKELTNMPYADKVKQTWDLIQARIKSGDYKPSYTNGIDENDVIIAIVQDEIFNQEASKRTAMLVNKTLTRAVQTKEIEAIQVPERNKRIGLSLFGGAAAGKSTTAANFIAYAHNRDFKCRDFARINTDSYRALLIDSSSVNPEDFSGLTQDEAAMIHEKNYFRLIKLKDEGVCPHIMVDQVYPAQNKLDLALAEDGTAFMIGVARDVEAAIRASKERGDATGRYVDTEALLSMHKGSAIALPDTLAENVGRNIEVQILDNNVDMEKGEKPDLICTMDLLNKKLYIEDIEKLERYLLNTGINEKARNANELYDFSKVKTINEYFKPLKENGVEIIYKERMDKKELDNRDIMFYTSQKYRDVR